MFAVGYGYPSQEEGSINLLQGSIPQFFGMGYMIIPLLGASRVQVGFDYCLPWSQ